MKPPIMLFKQQVKVTSYAGNNSLGEKIYNQTTLIVDGSVIVSSSPTETTIRCRFEPTVATDRQPQGEDKRYKATLFTLGADIPTQSTIIFENKKYIVSECIKHFDIDGNETSYLEVLLS